ncbi:hypothetical protein D3C87_1580630 [compost metagenome]
MQQRHVRKRPVQDVQHEQRTERKTDGGPREQAELARGPPGGTAGQKCRHGAERHLPADEEQEEIPRGEGQTGSRLDQQRSGQRQALTLPGAPGSNRGSEAQQEGQQQAVKAEAIQPEAEGDAE